MKEFAPRPAGKIRDMVYGNNFSTEIFATPEFALADGKARANGAQVLVCEGNLAIDDDGNEVIEVWYNDYYNVTK